MFAVSDKSICFGLLLLEVLLVLLLDQSLKKAAQWVLLQTLLQV